MPLTYPFPSREGTLTPAQVHELLQSPSRIARRVRTLADQRFIADFLLGGRYTAQGGGVFYETGEQLFASDDPKAVAPGAEYPKTVMTEGELAAAKVTKWGLETDVTDEAISRLGIDPVNRALARLVNTVVRHVDSVALAVIAAKVTASVSGGAWSTGAQIVEGVLTAKATGDNQGEGGYDMNTVVLKPVAFAKVQAHLINASLLPRENGNPVLGGGVIDALGLTWTTSPHTATSDPILVDRDQLGGMADENLGSPGYSRAADGVGVETKIKRDDDRDAYEPRARRVTVPVVVDPLAAIRITGTGL